MGPEGGLDVSIVSYRCEGLLRNCLQSLRDNPPAGTMSVHVVDNASGDGTAEMVRREFPDVRLTESAQNTGFSSANNAAIRAGSAPYVLVLNPDTRITPGSLDRLLALIESRPEIGMAGPRLELDDGSFDHAAKRSFPTPISALAHFSGIGRRRESGALAAYRAPDVESGQVDALNGAFMLMRRAALDQVGLFDEGFWMYMEDLDLCYRFAEAGWVTWYEPDVTVMHVKAGTSGSERSFRLNRAFHYGMYRFYRKHYAADHSPLFNLTIYAGILAKLTATVIKTELRRLRHRLRGAPDTAGEVA
jgi:GT2 family glycosyltransferase